VIECGPQGLGGTLRFESNRPLKVSVNVEPLGAPAWSRLAQGAPPTLELGPLETTGRRNLFSDYLQLGTHHILSGLDHLAFIAGLLLLASGLRMLLLTITAFTLAHSVTLALQTLGVTRAPVAAVELCIALSVLLLAVEASHKQQPTWTRQAPWLAAFSFGLLHGLGFASALSAVGIPGQHVALCLLAFNAGVEVGQLLVVLGLLALWRLLLRTPIRRTSEAQSRAQSMATLCLGGASAYWVLGRGQAWLTQLWSG
jgi:hydrogenase/urease accessory protein HupE